MAGPADHRYPIAPVPAVLLSRRWHGTLDTITDSERRGLRPIGTTVREVAGRTGELLTELLTLPGVRIFQGVCPPAGGMPGIPHVISAGHMVVLVESVAWPPGRYATAAAGRIHCDGVYIGQSVRPLITLARYWRQAMPPGHRVGAVIVVHPVAEGDLTLPARARPDLRWACAGDAVREISAYLPRGRQPVSMAAIAVLAAATGREGGQANDSSACGR